MVLSLLWTCFLMPTFHVMPTHARTTAAQPAVVASHDAMQTTVTVTSGCAAAAAGAAAQPDVTSGKTPLHSDPSIRCGTYCMNKMDHIVRIDLIRWSCSLLGSWSSLTRRPFSLCRRCAHPVHRWSTAHTHTLLVLPFSFFSRH